jgi:hypothetical protein
MEVDVLSQEVDEYFAWYGACNDFMAVIPRGFKHYEGDEQTMS